VGTPQHAIPQPLVDAMTKLNEAAVVVADEFIRLRDQINTGMSQADVDDLKTQITSAADRLKGFAADPNNPVPPTPPPPTPPGGQAKKK
jgi:hypothetical protein